VYLMHDSPLPDGRDNDRRGRGHPRDRPSASAAGRDTRAGERHGPGERLAADRAAGGGTRSHYPRAPRARLAAGHDDPRRALGRLGERLAADHLERLGFAIVERNARTRHGEIDLIAFDGDTLLFVEVKTRRARRRWRLAPEEQPLAWLRARQRARLRRLAAAWLHRERTARPGAHTIRFDAVGVIVDDRDRLVCLDHLEGAW
jgi:putative endonuclease